MASASDPCTPWDPTLVPHGILPHGTATPCSMVNPSPWDPTPNDFSLGSFKMEVRTTSTTIEPPGGFGCGVETEVWMASATTVHGVWGYLLAESRRVGTHKVDLRGILRRPHVIHAPATGALHCSTRRLGTCAQVLRPLSSAYVRCVRCVRYVRYVSYVRYVRYTPSCTRSVSVLRPGPRPPTLFSCFCFLPPPRPLSDPGPPTYREIKNAPPGHSAS